MARSLGPSDYGILGVLLSIVYLASVPLRVIQNSVTKFVSEYKAKKDIGSVNYLFKKCLKFMFVIGLASSLLFVFFVPFLSDFFEIPSLFLYFWAIIILFSMLLPVVRGVLQGMQIFGQLGVNNSLEGLSLLSLGVILVGIGFGLTGAVLAVVASFVLPFFLAFFPLRKFFSFKGKKNFKIKSLFLYTLPMLFALSILTGFYTLDLFLVKHFFSAVDAGYYAAISLLGKIIFFASNSITLVMFPKVIELKVKNKNNFNLMKKALLLISFLSLAGLISYFLFGKLIVWILFGESFLPIASYVGWFGLAMAFFSLSHALVLYNLSLNKNKFIYILFILFILELALILTFHSSLMQIITIMVGIMFALFVIMMFFTWRLKK
jgi:O-antigen/teichoic acid export membrane protein